MKEENVQLDMYSGDPEVKPKEPVECLGKLFETHEKRREHFLGILKEKLKDPEFRKIEGFPIGEDEDILALSDPPYYTACPNPWLNDFIEEWENQKPTKPDDWHYHREPFAADVSEGKNNPIYTAHSYHTKVPHKAIMRYILHYTEPGDIVFDGFCGTGMTGVASQMCGDRVTIESLGYRVDENGIISQEQSGESGQKNWKPFSKLGSRKAILNDLSSAATFIAYNYNSTVDVLEFEKEANQILKEVKEECGWMYETLHTDGKTKGKINYTVWSDVFICQECSGEVVFWEAAIDKEAGKVKDVFPCPHCQAELTKRKLGKKWTAKFDEALNKSVKQATQVPVLISYTVAGIKNRLVKTPDKKDIELVEKINKGKIPHWFPTNPLPDGYNTRQPIQSHGITCVHLFYTKRNLWVLSILEQKLGNSKTRFLFTGIVNRSTQMNRIHLKNFFFGGGGWNAGYLKGTLYISSLPIETSIFEQWSDRLRSVLRAFNANSLMNNGPISTQSCTNLNIKNDSLDYVFIDPPFGSNLNYSELSFIWESWLKVITNNKLEAIENSVQKKGSEEYRQLMTLCFEEAFRVLKPGRWMTVEFSNTKASVWNSIQNAITEAGFIVANVSALDKKQNSFKAVTTPTAVKQDLVISAYKPNGGFEKRFLKEAQTKEGVWDFIRTHLGYLPVTKIQGDEMISIPERDPRILFDQLVAYFVRRGFPIPISSMEFQQGITKRFVERDGMFFLSEQVAEYDRKKMLLGANSIQQAFFVSDEYSAINWLRNILQKSPLSFQDINPMFMKEISGWNKNEKPLELSTLLEQNFLTYGEQEEVPSQIHSYLSTNFKDLRNLPKNDPKLIAKAKDRWYVPDPNKAADLEKLRERTLLREFQEYRESTKKKLKVFRLEAVRAGFKKAWQERDYNLIIEVAQKIPEKVLQEDPKLLMWYDQAQTRGEQ